MHYSRFTPIALACVCTLVACSPGNGPGGGTAGTAGGRATPTTASPAATPSATPSPTGLPPDRYRAELKAALKPVRSSFASLAKARTADRLDRRLERAENALDGAVGRLDGIDPPPEAASEHLAYVRRLDDLHRRLVSLRPSVADHSLCSSSALLSRIGKGAFDGVRTAARELNARGDYDAPAIDVKVPKRRNRRLANGTLIRNGGRGGRGYLRIRNGLKRDAVVTLTQGKAKVLSVYVRRRSSYQINNIRDGRYRVYFTTGVDWDRSARTFTRNRTFERFEKTLRFRTVYSGYTIRWRNWSLTLHPVPGGNARTRTIRPRDYPR